MAALLPYSSCFPRMGSASSPPPYPIGFFYGVSDWSKFGGYVSGGVALEKKKVPSGSQSVDRVPPVCRAAAPSSSNVFRDLDADDFRHPLDKQNKLLLRAIPGLNEIGKALLGSLSEQIMLLENIGTSVLVSENQLPELHHLMTEAASILNIKSPPDLYVRQSPVPNAYTLAISWKAICCCAH